MAREPLVQDRLPLNEVKYAGRDYQTIFDALLRRLKINYADIYNDYADSAVGIMLIDLCAYAAGLISWQIDRTMSDCYLGTVRTPTAASRLTRSIGYKMYPAAAAGADLTLTFPTGIPGPCMITAGWRFQGPNGLQYESVADLSLDAQAAGYTTTLAIRQGETRTVSFVGDGTVFQQYRIDYADDGKVIADQSVRVWVDGAEWTEYPVLTTGVTAQFEVDYHAVPPLLRFGDGRNAGMVPPDGADIRVLFVRIVGSQGNVKANTITTVLDTLLVAGVAVPFTVTNSIGARSGRDAEDIAHAQRWAPYAFAARDGAVTKTDYQALSNSFVDPLYGAVAKAYAHTPREYLNDPVFVSYVDAITAAVDAFVAALAVAEVAITADVTRITAQVTVATDANTTMAGLRDTLETTVTNALSGCGLVRGTLQGNQGTLDTLTTALTDMTEYVNTNISEPTDKSALLALLVTAAAATSTVNIAEQTAAGIVGSGVESQLTAMQPLLTSGVVDNLENQLGTQAVALAAIAPLTNDIDYQVTLINNRSVLIYNVSNYNLAEITERISTLFDDSCRSNVVQVPILSVDPDGNYVAPPSGLMIQLQAFLDAKSETTQFVEVIDGSIGLVPADVLIRYKVSDGAVTAEVVSAIDATVRGVLRGRDYDDPLYLSDMYRYVRACSTGLSHVIITLSGAAADGQGNLVPRPMQVLILGSLMITELV